jgi:serine/threonine protein kinase
MIQVKIIKAFIPFTLGQALLVELMHSSTGFHSSLPLRFVLKLYDRRFMECRKAPWAPSKDRVLREILAEIAAGSRSCPPLEALGRNSEDEDGFSWDIWHSGFEEWADDVWAWQAGQISIQKEISAYRRLADLQGTAIPRFYGRVCIGTRQKTDWPPHWSLDLATVDGIAIEYIDGTSAECLKRGVDISEGDAERTCQAALQIMRDITVRGVLHDDIAARNVVVRHADLRPFLIDFGSARVQRADESLAEWKKRTRGENQVLFMRKSLSISGLHIRSPLPIGEKPDRPLTGWAETNKRIEELSPAERAKGYVLVIFPGSDHKIVTEEEGKEHKFEYPRWKLRPGARPVSEDYKWAYGTW